MKLKFQNLDQNQGVQEKMVKRRLNLKFLKKFKIDDFMGLAKNAKNQLFENSKKSGHTAKFCTF